ncbi:MAG: aspartate aminotransferase family protein [Spirochaetales bacterium]
MSSLVGDLPFPHNYADEMLCLDRGQGTTLIDTEGKRYLDLGAGIAVNALGYGRRDLARITSRQMRKLIHVSNLYATKPAISLGALLLSLCRSIGEYDAVHFGNSGAEATESAIKYARLYNNRTKGPGHHKLLSFSDGFHGRTMGALSVTANKKYSEPFAPMIPDTYVSTYNDPEELKKVVGPEFAAIVVEVVQGEGGLRLMSEEFAAALNAAAKEHDLLLIADEVQTGLGRTGKLFASEIVGLKPDIVTFSKPLAGGLPLSATLIPERVNQLLHPGDHGTTFGGGPVTTAVAEHVVRTIAEPSFLNRVQERGAQLARRLDELVATKGEVGERRGVGMLQGVTIVADDPTTRIAEVLGACRDAGVLLLRSSSNVLRFAPPLVISAGELNKGLDIVAAQLS